MNLMDSSETVKGKILDKNKEYTDTMEKYSSIWRNKFWPRDRNKWHYSVIQRSQKLIPFLNPKTSSKLKPHTVVLQGPAGVGKTTLAKNLMLEWTEDNLKKTFKYAFYLSCKELNQMGPCTCAELISKDCPELQDAILEVLDQSQRILIIIDGFDELRFPPGALIRDICGDWKQQKPVPILLSSLLTRKMFPRATLLITTRPWALRQLWLLMQQPLLIEMEGFLEMDRKEYFLKHFQDEDQALRAFDLMRSNTALFSMGSAPMVCWIVCTCLKLQMENGEDPTPTCQTTTSLFLRFVCSQFMPVPDSWRGWCLQAPVKAVCLLATEGVWTQTSVFDGEDLKRLGVKESELGPFLDKNILQKSKDCEGCYSFIHLSVQQFFAAMFYVLGSEEEEDREIHKGNIGDVQKLLSKEERLKNPILTQVGYFLFGLSNEKRARELETTFGCRVSTEVEQELLRWKVKSDENKPFSVMSMKDVFHSLYESQEKEFVKDAMAHFKEVSLRLKNETDVVHASFCLKHCQNLEKMSLKVEKGIFLENDTSLESGSRVERSRRDYRFLPLWVDLCSVVSSNENLSILDVSHSFLSDTSVRILCEQMARVACNLQKVVIKNVSPVEAYRDFCLAVIGKRTLTHLILEGSVHSEKMLLLLREALRHTKCNLQYLRLGSCLATTEEWDNLFSALEINQSLTCLNLTASELSGEDVKLLCMALKHPRCSLQILSLENCHLTEASCKDLSSALIINQKLTHLSLAKNELGDGGVRLLCEGLSYPDCKLQTLVLWGCSITTLCCQDLASALINNNSLESLDLGQNILGQSGVTLLFEALKQKNGFLQKLRSTFTF
ncbi:NACHT, LRR and PYD domains-containing protein 7 [Trichechus manatus latirostris]|uniref:NACHT, LRR and PYD domains-containing protein 7 n=1 Tax=Trichechus manatus latirostris TaxID=127582 RepID=A0A2Y9R9U6_TRIMA|nr:NACHT, LRR and PYD domains-containing protein 7 [Trichechus manatus latirostris]